MTTQRWTAEYRMVTDVASADSELTTLGTYVIEAGTNIVTTGCRMSTGGVSDLRES